MNPAKYLRSVILALASAASAFAQGGSAYLTNISTRAPVGGNAGTPIPGFALSGSGNKPVLVRAVGPTLAGFGVSGVLADPRISVMSGATTIATNDNWIASDATTMRSSGAFALGDASRDAALALPLSAGGYTAPVTAVDSGSGVALVEIYDTASGASPTIINASTRAFVGTGANILIPGFVISGTGSLRLLVRAVGPALTQFGVADALADPTMTLYAGQSAVASNDNWSTSTNAAEIASAAERAGAFPLTAGSRDAAVLLTLAPGAYTAVVSGVGATTGTALVEIYTLP